MHHSATKASFDWLERALGAERLAVYEDDEGRVVHAELRIGAGAIMAGDERAGLKATPPGVSVLYWSSTMQTPLTSGRRPPVRR
jgi:uncharacterized glyoxalase superfamily protein PhnB